MEDMKFPLGWAKIEDVGYVVAEALRKAGVEEPPTAVYEDIRAQLNSLAEKMAQQDADGRA